MLVCDFSNSAGGCGAQCGVVLMSRGIKLTGDDFSRLVEAGDILRRLAREYPSSYGILSREFDKDILRWVREDYLESDSRK